MQISLRSHLIAGVAAVGATAIAVTPVTHPDLAPSLERVSSAIELSAFVNPITAITDTIAFAANDIFGQAQLPAAADLFWPDSYYTPAFEFLFSPDYVGIFPDLVNQFSSGALSGLVNNLSGYANAGIYGITSLIGGLSQAAFDLLSLDVAQALADVQFAVGAVVGGVGYLIDNVIRNVSTIIANTIPGLLGKLIDTTVNGTAYLVQSAIASLTQAITSLTTLDIEGAWNAVIDGTLGPNGTLGIIEQLTVGIGIVQPVDYGEPDGVVDTVVIPSYRSAFVSTFQRLGDLASFGDGGIVNDPFDPLVAEPTASVAAPAAGEAAAEAEAPAAVTAADVSAAATAAATAEAPAADVSRPVAGSSGDSAAEAATAGATDSADASAESATPAPVRASAAEKPASGKGQATRGGRGGAVG